MAKIIEKSQKNIRGDHSPNLAKKALAKAVGALPGP